MFFFVALLNSKLKVLFIVFTHLFFFNLKIILFKFLYITKTENGNYKKLYSIFLVYFFSFEKILYIHKRVDMYNLKNFIAIFY